MRFEPNSTHQSPCPKPHLGPPKKAGILRWPQDSCSRVQTLFNAPECELDVICRWRAFSGVISVPKSVDSELIQREIMLGGPGLIRPDL